MTRFSACFDRHPAVARGEDYLLPAGPIAHPLPKRLLPEARGFLVTRLRATLRRPPSARPSLS